MDIDLFADVSFDITSLAAPELFSSVSNHS